MHYRPSAGSVMEKLAESLSCYLTGKPLSIWEGSDMLNTSILQSVVNIQSRWFIVKIRKNVIVYHGKK